MRRDEDVRSGPGAMGNGNAGPIVPDVGGNDGGNDAPIRGANDFDVCAGESKPAGAGKALYFDRVFREWLSDCVDSFQRGGGHRAVVFAWEGPVVTVDGERQPGPGGLVVGGCGDFSMDSFKERMLGPLPLALVVFDDRLARRKLGRNCDGSEAWDLLHGLLLGPDVVAVRGRSHEHLLDRSDFRAGPRGETRPQRIHGGKSLRRGANSLGFFPNPAELKPERGEFILARRFWPHT